MDIKLIPKWPDTSRHLPMRVQSQLKLLATAIFGVVPSPTKKVSEPGRSKLWMPRFGTRAPKTSMVAYLRIKGSAERCRIRKLSY